MRNDVRESEPRGEVSPWALAGLGMQFFVAVLLFVYAGNWLDRRFGTAPLFLLSGLFLGGGASFWTAYRRLTRVQSATDSHEATRASDNSSDNSRDDENDR